MSKFRSSSIIYIIGLHVLCTIMLVKSDFIEKLGLKLGLISAPEISEYFKDISTIHERMDGSIPEGATLFIGDSITQSLATAAITDLSVNYGIASDTTVGIVKRLPLYKSISAANAVVIAIGVNDLPQRKNSAIVDNYKKILDFFPRDKRIIVSAVLPVDEKVDSVLFSNKRIMKLNSSIELLTNSYENISFINFGEALKNMDGNLKSEFHTGDGVHLSTSGYQVLISLLRKALNNE